MFGSKKSGGLRIAINRRVKGKNKDNPQFWYCLRKGFTRIGRDLVYDLDSRADALLVMHGVENKGDKIRRMKENGTRIIHRIDGFVGGPDGRAAQSPGNAHLIEAMEMADAVVYQSDFCRRAVARHLPPPPPGAGQYVIYNGADEKTFRPEGKKASGLEGKRVIVTAAVWRKWKGLGRAIDSFLALDRKDSVLLVIGPDPDRVVDHPRVHYLGQTSHEKMARLYRGADLFLYLPWFDWCPNAVVQALVSGLPAVCSSRGGARELVGSSGIVVPSDPYDDVEDFAGEPVIDPQAAASAMAEVLDNREKYAGPRPDLHIASVARKYLEAVEETVGQEKNR